MKSKRTLKKSFFSNGLEFVFYPIAFFLVGMAVFYISFSSIISPLNGFLNVFAYAESPNLDGETGDLMPRDVENGIFVIPEEGQQIGVLRIDSASIEANVFYGDEPSELLKGIGCCMEAHLPGWGSTVLLAAHNNTFFHNLGKAQVGDKVDFQTNYGAYIYEITGSKVALETDESAYDLDKNEENLIMYTCYPFDELNITPYRYFVYAKYVSGPQKQKE